MIKDLLLCFIGGTMLSLNLNAQVVNSIGIETKSFDEKTYIEIIEASIDPMHEKTMFITWKMYDGKDIYLKIPMNRVLLLPSKMEISYVEFEFDYRAVQQKIIDLEKTISKVTVYQ
jgi:hypothetical protein